jgi:hypothetical protein
MKKEPIEFEYTGTRFVAELVERPAAEERHRADLYVQVDGGPRQRVGSVKPDLSPRDAEAIVAEWYDGF